MLLAALNLDAYLMIALKVCPRYEPVGHPSERLPVYRFQNIART
jgi:hypothetical protein